MALPQFLILRHLASEASKDARRRSSRRQFNYNREGGGHGTRRNLDPWIPLAPE
jgi:hypothetical protein